MSGIVQYAAALISKPLPRAKITAAGVKDLAEEVVRADARLRKTLDDRNHWRERALAAERIAAELGRLREESDVLRDKLASVEESWQEEGERARRLEDGLRAVKKAERAASRAHDAMWAMDFDKTSAGSAEREEWKRLREQASNEIWKLHEQLRPLLARLDQLGKEQT